MISLQGLDTVSCLLKHIVACHLPGTPSYGGVRTWVEGSQTRGDPALAEAALRTIKLPTNNAEYTPYSILINIKANGVGRNNIYLSYFPNFKTERKSLCTYMYMYKESNQGLL